MMEKAKIDPAVERQSSWLGRNWFWFVPVLFLPICGCGLCIFTPALIGIMGVSSAIKSSQIFQETHEIVESSEEVQQRIGEPITAGMSFSGNFQTTNGRGNADITYPISGPKGEATVHFIATREPGQDWVYEKLTVTFDDESDPIDLLPVPPPAEANTP